MSQFSRRQILIFFAGSAGAVLLGNKIINSFISSKETKITSLGFTPVRLPHPLAIYQQQTNFLPTGIAQGEVVNVSADVKLSKYNVIDDVVVPPEYERYVIVSWGDRVFPNKDDYFGYNNDFTGFIPLGETNDVGYLWVNHEYVSFPFSTLVVDDSSDVKGLPDAFESVIGWALPSSRNIEVEGEFLYNQGGSIVRISRQNTSKRFAVVEDAKNRRIHGLSGLGINSQRNDDDKPAIYAYAQKLLQENLQRMLEPGEKITVTIILPEGRSLAVRTSNSAFGVVEGLSLLGTTG
ncbi:cobalt-precorrin-5B (C(1))-methyltransferase [Nostoc sp. CHAB 5715]|nr:cobalt-precorrin-5B (C(1))-methyltransferase [Nostoc sp. CHAB 5715]